MGFTGQIGETYVWQPDPDSEVAHAVLLEWLAGICATFLPKPVSPSNWLKGNLGESIAHCVGHGVAAVGYRAFCANALDPLSGISKTEIDIVWLFFGESEADDRAVLQEVKTTTDPAMSVVGGLVSDYEKLFGTDVKRTLASRLHAVSNELEYLSAEQSLADRLRQIAAAESPFTATAIELRPTVVHEEQLDPTAGLLAVRETLVHQGWNRSVIESWSIALEDLDDRIVRLAAGE